MANNDTLCGWGDEARVAYFLANADIIIPRRAEQLKLLTELLPYPSEARISLIDLGAGFGAITERILEHYPRASVISVDGSQTMVALAIKRLGKFGDRVKILKADLADASWSDRLSMPFDAATSALAIHHLTHERKRDLYREVFQLLTPGGLFLNNDLVATPPGLKERFEALTLTTIQEQERVQRGAARSKEQIAAELREQMRQAGERHHSHIAALSDQLEWLREAGFESVDCYWRFLDLAIFGGVKP